MDIQKQRLTFASMWAFENIGVHEVEDELHQAIPELESQCEYSNTEDVLVVKGKLEGWMAPVAAMISSFIEKQKNKDLLDTPRLRLLDLPSIVQDNTSVVDAPHGDGKGGLLCLEDDSDATLIPHPLTRVTKFWLASEGGVGCFASNRFQDMLGQIAKSTGTEITVIDDLKGIQISGKDGSDVDDALAKLTRIEKPLSYLRSPNIANLSVGPRSGEIKYRVLPYTSLYPAARRRILADPTLVVNSGLGQMFVTASYAFDEDAQGFKIPKNIVEPPRYSGEPGKSRLWDGFTFQGVGKGDEFVAMESVIENNHAEYQLAVSGFPPAHPYLSPEKAEQVNQWVAHGSSLDITEMTHETKLELTPSSWPQPESLRRLPAGPAIKRTPGIKVRRPIQSAQGTQSTQKNVIQSDMQSSSEINPFASPVEPSSNSGTRKRWKMKYEPPVNARKTNTLGAETKSSSDNRKPSSNESGSSNMQKLEGKSSSPINFDATKYGLNKISARKTKPAENNLKAKQASHNMPMIKGKRHSEQNELIDIFTPVDTAAVRSHPPLRFNHPALIPERPTSGHGVQTSPIGSPTDPSMVLVDTHFPDLAGLNIVGNTNHGGSTTSDSLEDASLSKEIFADLEIRLWNLSETYHKHKASTSSTFVKPRQRPGMASRLLERRVIEDYERSCKPETEQSVNELESRQYHRTMNEKTAKPVQKPKNKTESLAKKQATLEDAWGMPKQQKKPLGGNLQSQKDFSGETWKTSGKKQDTERLQTQQKEVSISEDLKLFFAVMKPMLETAELFPGTITFEIQLGLVIIPLLPRTCSDGLMSPSEWSRIFQPRTGITAPTTKFINRVTASGSDVDRIIDMKTSRAEGDSRMFEQEYSEYNISYEFHCRTKADELLIIIVDEQGKYSIQKPSSILGAVNMHFPRQIWDARAVIGSTTGYRPGTNLEFEEAANYLVDHLWVPAEKQHIHMYFCLPKGNKIVIEKVFMKRWTRHRHIRPDEVLGRDSKKEKGSNDRDNQAGQSERNGRPDIFLQVMEVQDLFIGTPESSSNQPSDSQRMRARCTGLREMVRRGKFWYEVSLVSPAVETLLKANTTLEVGERTEDWRTIDLFGNDAAFLLEQEPGSPATVSPVAAAIGSGGIADLLRLAKRVVEKIDGVGSLNTGTLGGEALRMAAAGSQENRGFDFDDLESVKDVESVTARLNLSSPDAEAKKREQNERDFW